MIENYITVYGLCLFIALLAGFVVVLLEAKRLNVDLIHVLRLFPLLVVVGIIGARILFVVFGWDQFENNTKQIWAIWQGGFALYGAILFDLLVIWLYAKVCHIRSVGKLYDVFALAAALAIAIGRWGDYFMQISFGELISSPVKIPFIHVYIDRFKEWHLGLFFIESIGCLLIFVVLLIAAKRKKIRRSGDLMLWFLALYGALRIVLESMRQDSLFFGFVRIAQVLAACMVLCTLSIFSYRAFKNVPVQKRYQLIGLLVLALALLGAAFWAEFTMGQGREVINRMILAAGTGGLIICTYFIYKQTPKKIKRKRKKVVSKSKKAKSKIEA